MNSKIAIVTVALVIAAAMFSPVDPLGRAGETPMFIKHVVDADAHGTASLHAGDIDNDGDVDLLGAVLEEDAIVCWRNDGGKPPVWTRTDVAGGFKSAISVYASDLDGDGDLDVAGASARGQEIAVWYNDGHTPPSWTKQPLATEFLFAHEVYAHDLDGDGYTDVLAASTNLNRIAWWRNGGGDRPEWTEQTVDADFKQAKSVRVADVDGDGDLDIVGAALGGNEVAWWRNGGGRPVEWTRFTIAGDFDGAHRVQAVDIDMDGRVDVLAAAYGRLHEADPELARRGHEIAWWHNGGGSPPDWEKQVIGKDFPRACIAQAADMDDDGDLDVVGTSQEGNQVALWRNDGGEPVVWTKVVIDGEFIRVWPLYVVDLDGDGDQDVIAGSGHRGINTVNWWENMTR